MIKTPDITMFNDADEKDILSYKGSEENMAVRGLRVLIRHAQRFEPADWNGRKADSVNGDRLNEIIAKFQSMGTAISRPTLSGLYHDHMAQFIRTDKDGNETWNYEKMKARLADIKSNKVNAYPTREEVSFTRKSASGRVSKMTRMALDLKGKTAEQILAMDGSADLFNQLKRAFPK